MRRHKPHWHWLGALTSAGGLTISSLLLAMATGASAATAYPIARDARNPVATEIATSSAARTDAHLSAQHWLRVQAIRAARQRERRRERRIAARKAAERAARQAARAAAQAAAQAPAAPQQPAAPAQPSGSGIFSFSALESLWVSAGGPAWAESAAATIAECESGGRPDAYNPSGASGLWQILGSVVPGNLFDPMVNALNAVAKFKASGDTFAQWVCQA